MKQSELYVIAVDLDGTLLNDQKRISQYTKKIFECLELCNKLIVITTARDYKRTLQYLNEIHGHYAICNNGASIWKNDGTCLDTKFINAQVYNRMIQDIYSNFSNIELEIIMHTETVHVFSYQEALSLIKLPVEAILTYSYAKDLLNLLQYEQRCQKRLLEENTLLITSQIATKCIGLKTLLNLIHIPSKCTIAFGDDINDMEILEFCTEGIVPENGNPQVKKIATAICGTNNSDGIATWLSKRFNILKGEG